MSTSLEGLQCNFGNFPNKTFHASIASNSNNICSKLLLLPWYDINVAVENWFFSFVLSFKSILAMMSLFKTHNVTNDFERFHLQPFRFNFGYPCIMYIWKWKNNEQNDVAYYCCLLEFGKIPNLTQALSGIHVIIIFPFRLIFTSTNFLLVYGSSQLYSTNWTLKRNKRQNQILRNRNIIGKMAINFEHQYTWIRAPTILNLPKQIKCI